MADHIADDTYISLLNKSLLQAYKAEEDYWKQRSRQTWLALGDRNTAYFHASTKGRRARNRLTVIEDASGTPLFEDEQIATVISDYYSHIFYWGQSGGVAPVHDLWSDDQEIWHNGEYLTDLITDRAVDFIDRCADQPFFCYLPYNAPHYPMHAPQHYLDRFPDLSPDRRIMAAMIAAVEGGNSAGE